MSTAPEQPDLAEAVRTIYLEAHLLDRQRWNEWLDLFASDAVYWVPSWKSESETTDRPEAELSLIYYDSKTGLQDRVWRLTSGLSGASTPLSRTAHSVTNTIVINEHASRDLEMHSSWSCHAYQPKYNSQHVLFGRYEHTLRRIEGRWIIAKKTTIVASEVLPSVVDFYHL